MADLDQLPAAIKDFHLKEYESLKKEVSEQVEHTRKLEIYAVGGIAAFYAWFIASKATLPLAILTIPVLLALFGAWRSWATLTRITEIAGYLVVVESILAHKQPNLGWETYRLANPRSPFLLSGAAFWIVLVLVTAVAWGALRHC